MGFNDWLSKFKGTYINQLKKSYIYILQYRKKILPFCIPYRKYFITTVISKIKAGS